MVPKSYKNWAEIYKLFAEGEYNNLDFSDKSLEESYKFETYGKGNLKSTVFCKENNGFSVGKKLMDITIGFWKEDFWNGTWYLDGDLFKKFPAWFVGKVYFDIICTEENVLKCRSTYPNWLREQNYKNSMKFHIELGGTREEYLESVNYPTLK